MGRPTKEQAQAWTRDLLDEARMLFCEKGYAGASLDELAVRLKCSKHSIYRRFKDKESLFCGVIERDIVRFVAALDNCRISGEKSSPRCILHAMTRTYFDFSASRDYAALYAAMNLEAATSPSLRTKVAAWSDAALAPLQAAISAACIGSDNARLCEVIIDLLDGAAARLRLQDLDARQKDEVFLARWNVIETLIFPANPTC